MDTTKLARCILAALFAASILAGCGSEPPAPDVEPSNETPAAEEADAPKAEETEAPAAEEPEPESQCKVINRTDFDVSEASMSEEGIVFTISTRDERCLIMPFYCHINGEYYEALVDGDSNPAIHIEINGEEWLAGIGYFDVYEDQPQTVRITADGITDYSSFDMVVDATVWTGGQAFEFKKTSLEITLE